MIYGSKWYLHIELILLHSYHHLQEIDQLVIGELIAELWTIIKTMQKNITIFYIRRDSHDSYIIHLLILHFVRRDYYLLLPCWNIVSNVSILHDNFVR